MGWETILVALAGVPLARAGWANRRTALIHALAWATLAWLAWLWAAGSAAILPRYLALGLTGCAGVAVLGARRPGVAAWNVVVGGLLAVQLIPPVQDFLAGTSWLNDPVWKVFLGATAAVGLVNYLPTRLGLGAMALLTACGLTIAQLHRPSADLWRSAVILAATGPWLAWVGTATTGGTPTADRLWRRFRDSFGFLWAQRVREQLNNSARNAGLGLELGWSGLRRADETPPTADDQSAAADLLSALIQRFGLR